VTAFVPFCLRVYNSVHTFIAWWIPVLDDAASILSDYVCVCVCVCVYLLNHIHIFRNIQEVNYIGGVVLFIIYCL